MWFGCHPLRADFIKLKLTGANRRLPAALWVVIVHQSPHNGNCRVNTTIAFCLAASILINSNGNSTCWQSL